MKENTLSGEKKKQIQDGFCVWAWIHLSLPVNTTYRQEVTDALLVQTATNSNRQRHRQLIDDDPHPSRVV